MGMKCWFVSISDGDPAAQLRHLPPISPAATDALVAELFGQPGRWRGRKYRQDTNLSDGVYPGDDEIVAGVFGELKIVAHASLATDPDMLPDPFYDAAKGRTMDLFVLHSVVTALIETAQFC